MTSNAVMNTTEIKPEFDSYAKNYDQALQQGLSVSGEAKEYFAEGRVALLQKCLRKLKYQPQRVLDFGCGTGTSVPILHAIPGVTFAQGIDLSAESISQAEKMHGHDNRRFYALADYQPDGSFDLVFCNGVFHHIPLDQRAKAIETVYQSLKPGGIFALWENNPWNPATRYVMSRIPFDKDAITLTPPESRMITQAGGFTILRTDFLFIFPRLLKWFRPLEQLVSSWPVGTQYQILCRKPT
ncbi:MAG TPA: class I SAM-dependent methyltransferase [Gemmatales bacterium]|nr:class I SAM-dependent methyltransferase [Gemmatales bacterium]